MMHSDFLSVYQSCFSMNVCDSELAYIFNWCLNLVFVVFFLLKTTSSIILYQNWEEVTHGNSSNYVVCINVCT